MVELGVVNEHLLHPGAVHRIDAGLVVLHLEEVGVRRQELHLLLRVAFDDSLGMFEDLANESRQWLLLLSDAVAV